MFGKSKDSILAIDFAPDAVRVLDVVFRRGSPIISNMASGTLEAGTAENLPERHLAALGHVLSTNKIRTKQCVAALPTSLVVTRNVSVDMSKAMSVDEQIKSTLQATLSYDARDMIYDSWPVAENRGANRTYDILVVATQGAVVKRYLNGLSNLHLACHHLDVAPCAVASLLTRLLPEQETMVGTLALTEGLGYFAVVDKQRVLFWRPFDLSAAKAQPAGAGNLERIGDEISKCVSHMVGTLHFDGLTEIVAFGSTAHEEAFANYLLQRFNLQVRALSPFDSLAGDSLPAELKAAMQPSSATHYAAALGLALQTTGGSIHG